MSWVQLQNEVWPVTKDEAEWHVYVWSVDAVCPRVAWDWSVSHYIETEDRPVPGNPGIDRWLDIELGNLTLNLRDWRQLAGLEIRADAVWHATQEFIGPHGHHHVSPRVQVYQTVLKHSAERVGAESGRTGWVAHDFILRLGSRDGWSFPCELDAWLIPDEEYYRLTPETRAEAARFAEGPPDLRLITRATFTRGTVGLTRAAAADPVAHARAILAEEIACDTVEDADFEWMLRSTQDGETSERMPGWRSDVSFRTPAAER